MFIAGLDMKLRQNRPAGASSTLLNGLVSWWRLDEESGTRVDAVGSNDLTDNNTVGFAAGKIGNAADMVNGNNESLQINASLFDGSSFTFAHWQWYGGAATPVVGTALANATLTSHATNYAWYSQIDANSGGRVFAVFYDSVSGTVTASKTAVGTGNQWRLVVVTYDAATKKGGVSVDGSALSESTALTNGLRSDSAYFQWGRSGSSGDTYWRGDLAGLWSRVLTADERTELYNGGSGFDPTA